MATYKSITLTGAEQEIKISGQNCDIRNDSTGTIYASRRTPVAQSGNDVLSIPSGQAAKLLDSAGTVFLSGTGAVVLCGNDYETSVFKPAPTNGGASYLPSDGGTINGTLEINTLNMPQLDINNGTNSSNLFVNGQGLTIILWNDEERTIRRDLYLRDIDNRDKISQALQLGSNESGSWKYYYLYGEHNPQPAVKDIIRTESGELEITYSNGTIKTIAI